MNDPRTTEALLQMAEEGEADLARLLESRERWEDRTAGPSEPGK